jgi:hypothetical protein
MINLPQIYEAWKTNLDWSAVSPELREIFEARLSICEGCPHFVEKTLWKRISKIVDGKRQNERQQEFAGMKCAKCGCKMTWKVSSLDSTCPLTVKEDRIEPKWGAIITDADGKIISSGLNQI